MAGKKGRSGGARRNSGPKPGFALQLRRLALADANGEAEISLAKLCELRDHAEAEGVQLAAAIEIKNSVWGKPKQAIDHGASADLTKAISDLRHKRGLSPA